MKQFVLFSSTKSFSSSHLGSVHIYFGSEPLPLSHQANDFIDLKLPSSCKHTWFWGGEGARRWGWGGGRAPHNTVRPTSWTYFPLQVLSCSSWYEVMQNCVLVTGNGWSKTWRLQVCWSKSVNSLSIYVNLWIPMELSIRKWKGI